MVSRDLDAQYSLIGALLIDPSIAGEFFQTVEADDLTDSTCLAAYNAARELYLKNVQMDATTIANAMGEGYYPQLVSILEVTPTAVGWKGYAELARKNAIARRVDELSEKIKFASTNEEKQSLGQELMLQFAEKPTKDESMTAMLLRWTEAMETKQERFELGLEPLDKRLYITKGDMVILGARPSVGKTAMALQWADWLGERYKVGFFSFETGEKKLMDRLIARRSEVSFSAIQDSQFKENCELSEEEWIRIAKQHHLLSQYSGLSIIEASGWTVQQIQAKALAMKCQVIFIDYLQLISGKEERGYDRVTRISMALHTFAQRTGITVIAVAQLRRTMGVPTMSDLRESGQLEQDADVIMLMSLKDEEDKAGLRALSIDKNKTGECGKCYYKFNGEYQKFEYTTMGKG